MGKSAMKILGMKDEEFYEVGLNLSNLCNWYTVPLMEDSLEVVLTMALSVTDFPAFSFVIEQMKIQVQIS